MLKINLSKEAGFCFGVARAIEQVEKLIKSKKRPIFILGELVHNEHVINKLKKRGIRIIDSLKAISKGTLVITAHGADPKIISRAKAKGLVVLDTTCPKVTYVHQIAKNLDKQGYKILIYGDKFHSEILGILGEVDKRALVINGIEEARRVKIKSGDKIGLISQTTQNLEDFKKIIKIIRSKNPNCLVFNTICDSTVRRQEDIRNLARNNDLIIVIGSISSANTKRLCQISKKINPKTYQISTKSEIKKNWFKKVKNVGITAGASTPSDVIYDVIKFINRIQK